MDGCVGKNVLCGVETDPTTHANTGPNPIGHFFVEFMHGHNQISEKTYEILMNQDPADPKGNGRWGDRGASNTSNCTEAEL